MVSERSHVISLRLGRRHEVGHPRVTERFTFTAVSGDSGICREVELGGVVLFIQGDRCLCFIYRWVIFREALCSFGHGSRRSPHLDALVVGRLYLILPQRQPRLSWLHKSYLFLF